MRVENLKIKEVHEEIFGQAIENGNALMDDVVRAAQARCPIGHITREGKWSTAKVSFTPKTGKNKGTLVEFGTDKRWMGRIPGSLKDTIRRVNSERRPGNIRVYAGNFKVYYAFMIERGTNKMAARPFLRPAFESAKIIANQVLENGV